MKMLIIIHKYNTYTKYIFTIFERGIYINLLPYLGKCTVYYSIHFSCQLPKIDWYLFGYSLRIFCHPMSLTDLCVSHRIYLIYTFMLYHYQSSSIYIRNRTTYDDRNSLMVSQWILKQIDYSLNEYRYLWCSHSTLNIFKDQPFSSKILYVN